jgi:hypothetical protein
MRTGYRTVRANMYPVWYLPRHSSAGVCFCPFCSRGASVRSRPVRSRRKGDKRVGEVADKETHCPYYKYFPAAVRCSPLCQVVCRWCLWFTSIFLLCRYCWRRRNAQFGPATVPYTSFHIQVIQNKTSYIHFLFSLLTCIVKHSRIFNLI